MPAVLSFLPTTHNELLIGGHTTVVPHRHLDDEKHFSVIRFRRSEHPLNDGFYHGKFTRIVIGEKWRIHPDDEKKVLEGSRHKLRFPNGQWAEVVPHRLMRIVEAGTVGEKKPRVIAWVLT